MLCNAGGGGWYQLFLEKPLRFNVISITRGGWGSNFHKKANVTLEWPLSPVNPIRKLSNVDCSLLPCVIKI